MVAAIAGVTAHALLGHSKTELRVLCAGSLMVPFTEIEKAYEALNPARRCSYRGAWQYPGDTVCYRTRDRS